MSVRTLLRAFSAGELTSELFGRVDFDKFGQGLALCRNFITLPHGPAINRAGTEFVQEVKDSTKAVRLIPFSYNSQQTFAIQLGGGYFRFHTAAATLSYSNGAVWNNGTAYVLGDICSLAGVNYYCVLAHTNQMPPNSTYWYAMPSNPNIYEIPNAYTIADLMDIHYVQSSDVLTLVHPSYPPMELRRIGATNWQFIKPTFNPPACLLNTLTATPTLAGAIVYDYVVTGVLTTNLEESVACAHATCTNDLTIAGHYNTLGWVDGSGGAYVRYNVYKLSQGIYGYIGQAGTNAFVDNNITADVTRTPPLFDTVFASTGNYPAAVSYYEQRRCFGGTNNQPQNFWMTRSGTESNMSYTIPVKDDNRIAIRIASREASAIHHIVPVSEVLLLTASCEWKLSSVNAGAITPTSISVKPQSYNGANNVTPVVVGNLVLYAAARGGHVRELSYSWQANGYIAADISLLAPHLFDYNTIVDMAYCRGPIPTLWAVSSNGQLLGMTYVPEQRIAAWHHHDTGITDIFESICTISENNEDMLYAVVKRTINGAVKRYVERLHTRRFATLADAFFVDCGATYSGAPTTNVSGLTWLEGCTANILADGAVSPPQVVTGGAITLPQAASKITVGLPITADMQTLPAVSPSDGALGQGRPKNVNKAWLRMYRSSGVLVGASLATVRPFKQRTTEPYGSPPALVSDEIEITLSPAWGRSGQIYVRQTDPLPLDVAAITLEVEIGG